VSTLALHFIVIHAGAEYETRRGFSTGIVLDPPRIGDWVLRDARVWYFVLLAFAAANLLFSLNLLRSRTGRAWRAVRGREAVAEALGISVRRAKLAAFVISSAVTAVAGCLFAYYRGFVSVEAFSLYLTIQYVAMIIIGGMGSLLGAILGTAFVTVFPYAIEAAMRLAGLAERLSSIVFAVNYAAFGLVMLLFLVLEPQGLVGIWRRIQDWFLLWPFKQRPLSK
jgi:branched-chain amino acid transport system permease protein